MTGKMVFCSSCQLFVAALFFFCAYAGCTTELVSRSEDVCTLPFVLCVHRPVSSLYTVWRTLFRSRPMWRILSTISAGLCICHWSHCYCWCPGLSRIRGPGHRTGMLNAYSIVRKGPLVQESHRVEPSWCPRDQWDLGLPRRSGRHQARFHASRVQRGSRSALIGHSSESRRGSLLRPTQWADRETKSSPTIHAATDVRMSTVVDLEQLSRPPRRQAACRGQHLQAAFLVYSVSILWRDGGSTHEGRRVHRYGPVHHVWWLQLQSIDHARFREDITNSSLFSNPADLSRRIRSSDWHGRHGNSRRTLSETDSHEIGILLNTLRQPMALTECCWCEAWAADDWKDCGRLTDASTTAPPIARPVVSPTKPSMPHVVNSMRRRFGLPGPTRGKRWSAIRDVLHSSGPVDVQTGGRTLCETFTTFFTNKIRSVKAAIATRLTGVRDRRSPRWRNLLWRTIRWHTASICRWGPETDWFDAGEVLSDRQHPDIDHQILFRCVLVVDSASCESQPSHSAMIHFQAATKRRQ